MITANQTERQPVRYIMKQKIWSLGDTFTIRDEGEKEVFVVRGKAFSWGDKLSFQDIEGRELAYISQKLLSWKPRYEIYRDGSLFAEVVKEFTFLKAQYTLDVPGPNDYTIRGDFLDHEYVFERSGEQAAQVSKKFWAWTDVYGVDIREGEDDVALLATCVVIDLVSHNGKGE